MEITLKKLNKEICNKETKLHKLENELSFVTLANVKHVDLDTLNELNNILSQLIDLKKQIKYLYKRQQAWYSKESETTIDVDFETAAINVVEPKKPGRPKTAKKVEVKK